MRTTSVRLVERESRETPAVALVTGDACFWRREEVVASRESVDSEVARQREFEVVKRTPVEHEEWATAESRAQCGVAGSVFDWRDSDRLVCEEAFQLRTPNQSLEPTPTAVTICACAQLAPAAVVAHL